MSGASAAAAREAVPGVDPWAAAMRAGDFAAAWAISDRVLAARRDVPCHHWPRHLQYLWHGDSLAGKRVLVRCYHGLGDTVMFARFLPQVRAIARETIVWAQPALLPLLRRAPGIDRLFPLHDGVPECEFDIDVEIMELAHVFRTTLETIPRDVPYLENTTSLRGRAGADRAPGVGAFTKRTAAAVDELRVGLVWRAGEWDARRSLPLAAATELARVPGVRLHVLQAGPARAEWPQGLGVLAGAPEIAELAREIAALDLVISVDSFPAHLAGALAVPTWLLLSADPDWRWMRGREDSPWYPTMRLFRQERAGEWNPVIARVTRELAVLAGREAQGNGGARRNVFEP